MSARDESDVEPAPSLLPLRILEPAARDIADILIYTLDRWGSRQEQIYGDRLRRGLEALRFHPEMGRARRGRLKRYRSVIVAEHVVFYRVEDDTVVVARVTHVGDRPPLIPPS